MLCVYTHNYIIIAIIIAIGYIIIINNNSYYNNGYTLHVERDGPASREIVPQGVPGAEARPGLGRRRRLAARTIVNSI